MMRKKKYDHANFIKQFTRDSEMSIESHLNGIMG